MIRNFEKQTHKLTQFEMDLVPGFVSSFKKRIGKQNAITNKEIKSAYKSLGKKVTDARIRKIINHIRINRLVPMLCATSKGYFVASNSEELNDYIIGLRQRISAQQEVLKAVEKDQSEAIFNP